MRTINPLQHSETICMSEEKGTGLPGLWGCTNKRLEIHGHRGRYFRNLVVKAI